MTMEDVEKLLALNGNECDDKLLCEIDTTLELYFEILDSLYRERAQLNSHMKDGFIMMSKARYSMGVKSVSQLQYDENNMLATAKVKVIDELHDSGVNAISFQLIKQSNDSPKPDGTKTTIKSSDKTEGVRRRMVNKKKDSLNLDEANAGDELSDELERLDIVPTQQNEGEKTPQKTVDPVKWFGVLVPQALRTSQNRFKHATEYACQVATLQKRLEEVRLKYLSLMREKTRIFKSSSDKGKRGIDSADEAKNVIESSNDEAKTVVDCSNEAKDVIESSNEAKDVTQSSNDEAKNVVDCSNEAKDVNQSSNDEAKNVVDCSNETKDVTQSSKDEAKNVVECSNETKDVIESSKDEAKNVVECSNNEA